MSCHASTIGDPWKQWSHGKKRPNCWHRTEIFVFLYFFYRSNRQRGSRRRITLDPNHFGFLRAGRPRRRKEREWGDGRKRRVFNPGPTSMVVSWTVSHRRRVQARANLNGGELDKEPFLRDERGLTTVICASATE